VTRLQAGRSTESRPGEDTFLQNIHTCSGVHPASIQRVLGLFPCGKTDQGMISLPSSKRGGVIPVLPLCLHGTAGDNFNCFCGFVVVVVVL